MTETKFTPGPWEVDFENCHAGQVATCHGDGDGYYEVWSRSWLEHGIDQKANAHLIAAAPDLLESLTNLVGLAKLGAAHLDKYNAALSNAESAIAKARGES